MNWKAFFSSVGQLTIAFVFASVLTFVVLNMMVQCETWEDPACVTPNQFMRIFTGG